MLERPLTGAACLLSLVGAACTRPAPPPTGPKPPEVVMHDVRLVHSKGADVVVLANAPRLELSRSSGDLFAVDASVTLPARGVVLTAGQVEGNLGTGHLEGRGGVTMRAPDGTHAASPAVTFERSSGAGGGASSDAGVRVEGEAFVLDARGFDLDFAEQRAAFSEPVTKVHPTR